MDPVQIILFALIVAAGGVIQSAVGFGTGLFATMLLLLSGMPAEQVVPFVSVVSLSQTVVGAWKLRELVLWKLVVGMVLIGMTMQPVGVWLLSLLTAQGPVIVKQVFGLIILTALAAQWWLQPHPRERLHWGWAVLTMIIAGLMHGLAGMSGPPIVLWVMAHNWTNHRSRAMLWAFFSLLIPANLVNYAIRFGDPAIDGMLLGVAFIPFMLIGMVPGMWIGHRMSKARLKQMAMVVLLLVATYGITESMIFRGSSQDAPPPSPAATSSTQTRTTDQPDRPPLSPPRQ